MTLIDCVVAPFDHRNVEPVEAVRVTWPPLQNVIGPLAVMLADGAAVADTFVELLLVQPPFATVTLRPTVPAAVAVNVMLFVPLPAVIVPFVSDHEYVAPVCAVTLAVAAAFVHIVDGAVIAGDTGAFTTIDALLLLVQPPFVAVTETWMGEVVPAVTTMLFVPCPDAIVALPVGIDHV